MELNYIAHLSCCRCQRWATCLATAPIDSLKCTCFSYRSPCTSIMERPPLS